MTFDREPRDAAVVGDRVNLSKRVYSRVLQFVSFRCKCKKFCVVALTMESPRNDDPTYRNRRVTNSQRARGEAGVESRHTLYTIHVI